MNADHIFVTNNNPFQHQDSFDGKLYIFPPGEKVAVPIIAAQHMFGFGNPDRTETLVRLGWANTYNQDTKQWDASVEGVKKLSKFTFTQAIMVEAEIKSPAERVPMLAAEANLLQPPLA